MLQSYHISSITITFNILPHGILQGFWQIIEFVSKLLDARVIFRIFGDVYCDSGGDLLAAI